MENTEIITQVNRSQQFFADCAKRANAAKEQFPEIRSLRFELTDQDPDFVTEAARECREKIKYNPETKRIEVIGTRWDAAAYYTFCIATKPVDTEPVNTYSATVDGHCFIFDLFENPMPF